MGIKLSGKYQRVIINQISKYFSMQFSDQPYTSMAGEHEGDD